MARSGEKKERQKARKLERGVTVSQHSSPTRSLGGVGEGGHFVVMVSDDHD